MTNALKSIVIASCIALALAGCAADPGAPEMAPPESKDDPRRETGAVAPAEVDRDYSGVYELRSTLDLAAGGVLPGAAGPALAALSQVHDHPGQALLSLLEAARIPEISDLLAKLPKVLLHTLGGLLDGLIIEQVYRDAPAVDWIAAVVMDLAELARGVEVHDRLLVYPPAKRGGGACAVEHTLVALDFHAHGRVASVALAPPSRSAAPGAITPGPDARVADADLKLAPARFDVPIGDLLLEAAEPLVFARFGGARNLAGALRHIIDCGVVGRSLSEDLQGLLSPAEGESLCGGGVGLLAQLIEQEVSRLRLDDVDVRTQTATLRDATPTRPEADRRADRVANGQWTWRIRTGADAIEIPATFAGDRIGDASNGPDPGAPM